MHLDGIRFSLAKLYNLYQLSYDYQSEIDLISDIIAKVFSLKIKIDPSQKDQLELERDQLIKEQNTLKYAHNLVFALLDSVKSDDESSVQVIDNEIIFSSRNGS